MAGTKAEDASAQQSTYATVPLTKSKPRLPRRKLMPSSWSSSAKQDTQTKSSGKVAQQPQKQVKQQPQKAQQQLQTQPQPQPQLQRESEATTEDREQNAEQRNEHQSIANGADGGRDGGGQRELNTESITCPTGEGMEADAWYSGMLSMLSVADGNCGPLSSANASSGEEGGAQGFNICGTAPRDSSGILISTSTSARSAANNTGVHNVSGVNDTTTDMMVTNGNANGDDEARFQGDDDSVDSEDVSSLGKGLGDDLKSLPSVPGTILPGEDGSVGSLDNVSLHTDNQKDLVTLSSSSRKTFGNGRKQRGGGDGGGNKKAETVESVVEKKISNLKSERQGKDDTKTVPFLRRKMFPKISGRSQNQSGELTDEENVLETRRQMLVTELRQTIEKHGRWHVKCANITAALGDLYDENSEYKQATKLHMDAISVYSIKLGDDHQSTLDAKMRLAQVYENATEYDAAIGCLHGIMCMTKAMKGDKDPSVSDVMAKIAAILKKKGKYELAIKTLKRALKTYRDILGDSHPSVSTTVDSIASLYVTIGDFTKASAILEEVVKLKAATLGVASKEVAASLCELATCYECAEQYGKAMKNLKKAYKIYADISGESGEKAILTLERIALIYQATGQFKKAAIAYLGVLRGRKRALGDSHPTVADTYFHLGVSLRESCQQEKALKCMKQALNIYVGEGKDMHDVEMIAEVMHELAIIHRANNNMNDAIKTFKQEIAVRRKLGQPEYPLIAQTLNHLGVAEFDIKNYNRALNYFMEALTIYEKRGTEVGIDFAEVLYNTGLVFEAIRNKPRAYDAFLEAARIFTEHGYDRDHPHLAKAAKKLRKLGHSCKCEGTSKCSATPCVTLLATTAGKSKKMSTMGGTANGAGGVSGSGVGNGSMHRRSSSGRK